MAAVAHFTARYPQNIADLHDCFTMLEQSAYYDYSMTRNEVIRAWDRLLREGTGQLDIVESSHFAVPFEPEVGIRVSSVDTVERQIGDYPPYFALHFTAFITRRYAKHIVENENLTRIGMDFLHRYNNFFERGVGYNPACTKDDIEKEKDGGVYLLAMMLIVHPSLQLDALPEEVTNKYAMWNMDTTTRMFGGFNYQAWLHDIVGETVKDGAVAAGQTLLRESPNNQQEPQKERRCYLICTTRDKETSDDLGIPTDIRCHIEFGNWFHHLFLAPKRQAELSYLQKQAGMLLVLGFTKEQIASMLYPDEAILPNSMKGLTKRVAGLLNEIGEKLKKEHYLPVKSKFTQRVLEDALLANLHEVRPVIIPFYPDKGI